MDFYFAICFLYTAFVSRISTIPTAAITPAIQNARLYEPVLWKIFDAIIGPTNEAAVYPAKSKA